MGEITVSAKTVDDAITEALIQLGVTSDMLEYDVIEKEAAVFLESEANRLSSVHGKRKQ